MDFEALRGVTVILGPILLGAVILWAYLRNRKERTPGQIAKAERGAREVRETLNRDGPDRGD